MLFAKTFLHFNWHHFHFPRHPHCQIGLYKVVPFHQRAVRSLRILHQFN